MTTTQTDRLMAMFDDAIKSSRLQGGTDAKKGFGIYTEEDSRFYVAMHKSIAEKRASLLAALQARNQQGPIKTWQQRLEETCPAIGPMHIHACVEEVNDAMQAEIDELRSALQEQTREGEADCRIELVTAVHMLASHYENNLYNLNGDEEALRLAKGDIAHAMKIAAKWNWNGSAPQPEQPSEPAQPEQGPST